MFYSGEIVRPYGTRIKSNSIFPGLIPPLSGLSGPGYYIVRPHGTMQNFQGLQPIKATFI
jgi:hypothetical protein